MDGNVKEGFSCSAKAVEILTVTEKFYGKKSGMPEEMKINECVKQSEVLFNLSLNEKNIQKNR